MPNDALDVLYEDNHLLVLNKPAGLPTMGTPGGEATLLSRAKDYLKQKYAKPGNVYLGVVSRLDAPVTGLVLFARTSKSAARLTEQYRTRAVQKTYWALVPSNTLRTRGKGDSPIFADTKIGTVPTLPASGSYLDWLAEDERHRRMHVVSPDHPAGKEARLTYRRIADDGRLALLEIGLETGRKHQIRVQLAHHGEAVAGDRKYGSPLKFPVGIALHARRLVILHPVRGEPMEFLAPLPRYWPRAFQLPTG